jgi:hypothetical protein
MNDESQTAIVAMLSHCKLPLMTIGTMSSAMTGN